MKSKFNRVPKRNQMPLETLQKRDLASLKTMKDYDKLIDGELENNIGMRTRRNQEE